MPTPSNRPKIGLLGLTLELYQTLAPALQASREQFVRAKLKPLLAKHATVMFDGAVCRRTEIDAAVARFERAGVDAIVVVLLSYSPSQLALPALARTRLPIIIWNTQELWAVDDSYDGQKMVDNHGVHGTQDLANVLLRSGVKFQFVTSHPDDAEGLQAVGDCIAAATAVRRLRQARIGLLGYPFPGMGDFALDTTALAATLGCQWISLSVADYNDRAAAAPAAALKKLVSTYRRSYDLARGLTEADLQATARTEWALRGMVKDHQLQALTYQFLAFGEDPRTLTVPFVAMSRLMAEGIGFGGEGDLIGAAGSSLLHWLCPPATFSEVFTIDFAGNGLFMSHMGEANVAMHRPDRKVKLLAREGPITRTQKRQLELITCLPPVPATLFALTLGPKNRWRLIASPMEIADFGPLPTLDAPHFKLLPRGDVRSFLTDYALAGGPHHNAVCFGDARARLRRVAELLDADYCEI